MDSHQFKKFLNSPKYVNSGEHIHGRIVWELKEVLYWMTMDDAIHAVPDGYKWDGWSVSWFCRWIVRKVVCNPLDAILHDRGYEGNLIGWTRVEVDRLLPDVVAWAKHDRVDSIEAWIAVRICGWYAWRKNRSK